MFQREIAVLVHFSKNKENNESLGGMFEREIPVLVCHSGFGRWLEAEQIHVYSPRVSPEEMFLEFDWSSI